MWLYIKTWTFGVLWDSETYLTPFWFRWPSLTLLQQGKRWHCLVIMDAEVKAIPSVSVDIQGQEEFIIPWQEWECQLYTKLDTTLAGKGMSVSLLLYMWSVLTPRFRGATWLITTVESLDSLRGLPWHHRGRGILHYYWVMVKVQVPYSTFSDSTLTEMGVGYTVPATAWQGCKSRFPTCLCPLAFPDCWLTCLQVWDIWGK